MDYDQTERPPSQGIIFCHQNGIKVSKFQHAAAALQLSLEQTDTKYKCIYSKIPKSADIYFFFIELYNLNKLSFKADINYN